MAKLLVTIFVSVFYLNNSAFAFCDSFVKSEAEKYGIDFDNPSENFHRLSYREGHAIIEQKWSDNQKYVHDLSFSVHPYDSKSLRNGWIALTVLVSQTDVLGKYRFKRMHLDSKCNLIEIRMDNPRFTTDFIVTKDLCTEIDSWDHIKKRTWTPEEKKENYITEDLASPICRQYKDLLQTRN